MDRKVELLAPAGDWEAFLAAVENGADAVYLGGKLFNARQFAGNFDAGQLKTALDYAHVRGVRVYLTMNTLIADSELRQAVEFAESAYIMGIDGIIVQDTGFAGVLRKLYPGLDLHASTQMTVYNLDGVRALECLGFKRVVLARELCLDEIRYITENSSIEIEVFAHGALCVCYSGQCLMSSLIGGRSGNRGRCAQPCRLEYELVGPDGRAVAAEGKHLLSPRDLCLLGHLPRLAAAGVRALKIEGRMKSPEYVATVVRVYRQALDRFFAHPEDFAPTDEELRELAQIYNRGFTPGFFLGDQGAAYQSYARPNNRGCPVGRVTAVD
ncbi:MAG: U32 family peptidase, partial [Firmicutes bacterium]|nr:U32 family peptidase [Bacillota bacterium]